MGCVENITFEKFPKQADENYKYPHLGKRVEVCYHYDTSKTHYGTIVREDIEEPFETIIKLDNGRYLRAVECQYSILDEDKVDEEFCEWRVVDRPNGFPIYTTSCGAIRLACAKGIDIYCNACGKKIKVVSE